MNNLPDHKALLNEEDDSIDYKRIFAQMYDKWLWFLLSAIICLLVAYIYTEYTAPKYQIYSRLLVNDDEKSGGLGKQSGAMMDLGGLLGSSNSVDNEAEILKTRFLMEQVVRDLQLNIIYCSKVGIGMREMDRVPFKLNIINSVDTIQESKIELKYLAGNKIAVKSGDFSKEINWNETFKVNGVGLLQLVRTPGTIAGDQEYIIKVQSVDKRVAELMKELTVTVANKQVTIIDLSLEYPLKKQGEQVLNTIIRKYVEGNLNDKNSIADSTYKFINERLSSIAGELGDVENKVEQFKQTNKLADMSEQSKLLVKNTGEYASELAKAETQVTVLSDLESYLKDESKNKRVFPTSLLPSDIVFSDLLAQYNALLIERDKQLLSVKEGSPFIQNIDDQIAGLRAGILANIQSTKNTYVLTRNKLRSQLNQVEGQIGGVPVIEKNYLKLARNQQIKQELYIFLMQKAEETAISKTSNISVAKVIDPPKAMFEPISPKKLIVYLSALFAALLIPFGIIFASEYFITTIATKEDITRLTSVPIVGEISHNKTPDNMIVQNQGRSAISEQFRAIRTNLSFYTKKDQNNTILLTSSMSGEGKSFTSINLGIILASSGKKVLLMELDLRKPGLSAKLNIPNVNGFTNYITDENVTVNSLIKPLQIDNLFFIPSGPLPPNPAETLLNDRTELLMTALKKDFDYIIVDAPPVGIIADAQTLSNFADVTLYLVRQKVTQKSNLSIVEDLYQSKKMKNIGIVVNDIVSKTYGYGFNYGNYGDQIETGFFDSLIQKLKGK